MRVRVMSAFFQVLYSSPGMQVDDTLDTNTHPMCPNMEKFTSLMFFSIYINDSHPY